MTISEYLPILNTLILVFMFIYYVYEGKKIKNNSYNNKILNQKIEAYQRIILFINRLSPNELNNDILSNIDMSTNFVVNSMISKIRSEYSHNVSQRLFLDEKLWKTIEHIKEETINYILNCYSESKNNNQVFSTTFISDKKKIGQKIDVTCQLIKENMNDEINLK